MSKKQKAGFAHFFSQLEGWKTTKDGIDLCPLCSQKVTDTPVAELTREIAKTRSWSEGWFAACGADSLDMEYCEDCVSVTFTLSEQLIHQLNHEEEVLPD